MQTFTTHTAPHHKPLRSILKQSQKKKQSLQELINLGKDIHQSYLQQQQGIKGKHYLQDLETSLRTMRVLKQYLDNGYWNIHQALTLKKISLTPRQVLQAWLWHKKELVIP